MTAGPVRRTDPATRFVPGPEPLGIIVAAVVVVAVLLLTGASRAGGPGQGSATTGPTSSVSPGPDASAPTDVVSGLLRVINNRLLQHAEALGTELERDPLRPEELALVVGELRATARLGADTAPELPSRPGDPGLGDRLAALYGDLDRVASDALTAGAEDPAAYVTEGRRLLELLNDVPALQAALGGVGDASPGPSAGPGGDAAGEQVVNGGFEQGAGSPWSLALADGMLATLRPVTTLPAEGSRAARIEILTSADARAAISLRQPGLELVAGRTYVVAIAVRATGDRDVRVRIASPEGDAYSSRLVTAGIAWNAETWSFTAPATDRDAVLEIDLGRSMEAVWIDGVSFRAR